MKRIVAACIALAAGMASAAPLNMAQIPSKALWYLHADCENLRGTAPGRVLMESMTTGAGGSKMDALAKVIGLDLRKDLADLTLYSFSEKEEEGVAILHGKYDAEHLKTLLKANDGYRVETREGGEVLSWIDEQKKQRKYGAMLPGDLIVVSGSRIALHTALDVIGAKAPSLERENANRLPMPESRAAFVLAGADLSGMNRTNRPGRGQMLRQARAGSLSFAEQGGQIVGRLTLQADTDDAAKLMADAGRGLLAVAQLNQQENPAALEMLQGIRVEQVGSAVQLNLTTPAEKAAVWLRMKIEEDQKKKAEAAAAIE